MLFPFTTSREDEFRFALFHFRAGERDPVSLAEVHAHVVEKGLRAQVNVDGARTIPYQQMPRRAPGQLPKNGATTQAMADH